METKKSLIHPLVESIEEYGKTSFELIKLKTVEKTSKVVSTLVSRVLFIAVVLFFTLMVSIAAALWLGEILGKMYHGFLLVGAFYGLTGTILLILHPWLKTRIGDSIIEKSLN